MSKETSGCLAFFGLAYFVFCCWFFWWAGCYTSEIFSTETAYSPWHRYFVDQTIASIFFGIAFLMFLFGLIFADSLVGGLSGGIPIFLVPFVAAGLQFLINGPASIICWYFGV